MPAYMYSLPNVHKVGIPFRPILSMVGLVQHKLAKCLVIATSFRSVFFLCPRFIFASLNLLFWFGFSDKLIVLFDIVSLFINVPIQETLQICTDTLYRNHLSSPNILENLFLEFMPLRGLNLILIMPRLMVYR